MNVTHDPRLAAGVVRWRAFGRDRLTVVIRLAFAFGGGRVELAPPAGMTAMPPYAIGDEAVRAMAASDRAPYIGKAEVTFLGRSHAAPGSTARLAVARGDATLLDKRVVDTTDVAPIPPDAPARTSLLRDADREGLGRDPVEIGEGFPWEALQTAREDQRVAALDGSEMLTLDGLLAGAPHERIALPGLRPRVVAGGAECPARLDRIHVDGEARRVTLTFRALLPADATAPEVRVALGEAPPSGPLSWPRAVVLQPPLRRPSAPGATAVLDGPVTPSPATPFRAAARAGGPRVSAPVVWSALARPSPAASGQAVTAPLRLGVDVPAASAFEVTYAVPSSLAVPAPAPAAPIVDSASALGATDASSPRPPPRAPEPPPAEKPSLGERFLARRGGKTP
jgi:hypothetical protein